VTDSVASEQETAARRNAMAGIFASEASFRAFYALALPKVYAYLYNRSGGDAAVTEELTQQTFVTAVRERARFDGRADPLTWLTAIARHKLADHFRRLDRDERRRMRLVVREITVGSEARAWDRREERDAVVDVLASLSALQRAVLVLHYADGLSVREVGRELEKSESAIESLLTRAREAFRRNYERADDV